MPTAARFLFAILEKQGLAVVLVAFGVAWASGWIPFRLCEPVASQANIIAAMESDRRQMVGALNKIADAMTETTKAAARMDTRDSIRTCASIADKDARTSCIQVAVTGK